MRIPEQDGYKIRRGTDRRQVKLETCSQNAEAPARNALLWITVVLIPALILIVLSRHYKLPDLFHVPGEVQSSGVAAQSEKCQLLPPHGSAHVIDPSAMNRIDVLHSGVQIDNQHDYPLIALLSDAANSVHYFAISVAPGEAAHFSAPVGHYGMQVFVGSTWCDLETGFSDGAKVTVDGGIAVQAGKITALEFYGSGIDPVQLALAYSIHRSAHQKDKQRPLEIIGTGKIELLQANNGHYFSVGTINDAPVLFLIDTGATYVSVSSKIAERAGIRECLPHHVMTANGSVDACMAIVSVITFGAFQLNDVEVIVLPDMFDEALLGMNILHHFRIEQANQVMRISLQ
ncbi:MAG: retroviral-like aspartic protease family protein [Nitrosomonas sp.]|nr:retroviral-like aspartic protease family protein [Nitrosomonas sp.]